MGYKHDQRLPSEIHDETLAAAMEEAEEPLPPYPGHDSRETLTIASDPDSVSEVSWRPPPLPPRENRATLPLPTLPASDPRTTSQESLVPPPSQVDGKRILLLIYIHGFMGNETSFASFPAHVHSLLSERVRDTHAVHTKIYPKYKTRNDITVVRGQFSQWLAPHESPTTDVILLGHSMGGIVAAEVALIPSISSPGGMKHRLLGTLNLDVPFMGMHPGIIGAGLASLFGGAAEQPQFAESNEALHNATTAEENVAVLPLPVNGPRPDISSMSSATSISGSSLATPDNDPYFNPSYTNDLPVPIRKPAESFFHFVDKHLMKAEQSDLLRAGGKLITSHLEFGGTMAQYTKLDSRYKQLRALEKDPTRVRFVNYFSTCYGRTKPPKARKGSKTAAREDEEETSQSGKGKELIREDDFQDEQFDSSPAGKEKAVNSEDDVPDIRALIMTLTDPIPEPDHVVDVEHVAAALKQVEDTADDDNVDLDDGSSDDEFEDASEAPDPNSEESKAARLAKKLAALPALPEEPTAPGDFDPAVFEDKDAQKLAKQQYDRDIKAYKQAVKDRNTAVKEREKLIAKYVKENMKDQGKQEREEEKARQKAAQEADKAAKKAAREKEAADKKAAREKEAEEKKAEKQRIKQEKLEEKEILRIHKLEEKERAKAEKQRKNDLLTKQQSAESRSGDDDLDATAKGKPKKLKTFCLTPPKATSGQRSDWVPVFVENADQVTAHCGLFKIERPHYEEFVQTVVENISDWVDQREGSLVLG